jgi:hypothetical protein
MVDIKANELHGKCLGHRITFPNCHYTEIYAIKFLNFAGDQEYMSSYSRHDFLIITFCGEREDKQPCTYYYIPFLNDQSFITDKYFVNQIDE